jgi:hypothetical protein
MRPAEQRKKFHEMLLPPLPPFPPQNPTFGYEKTHCRRKNRGGGSKIKHNSTKSIIFDFISFDRMRQQNVACVKVSEDG